MPRVKRLGLGGVANKPEGLFGDSKSPEPRFEDPKEEEEPSNFFVTGVDGEPNADDNSQDPISMEQEAGEVDEDFGQRKMEHFKDRCR